MHVCRVSDASGELQITEVGRYPLKVELLDSKVIPTLLACVVLHVCEELHFDVRMRLLLILVVAASLLG